ncbi:MAG: pro-sigmaK processing inhibitor BofA family protein [Bacilli bacterium]|nr:pro-sigmaK processing inhibitor BofA family protein [Bacilli bacterium]MBR1936708.1 pro-sigmaK processing inhibitor BofA family protein [Bacilli bacterium]
MIKLFKKVIFSFLLLYLFNYIFGIIIPINIYTFSSTFFLGINGILLLAVFKLML